MENKGKVQVGSQDGGLALKLNCRNMTIDMSSGTPVTLTYDQDFYCSRAWKIPLSPFLSWRNRMGAWDIKLSCSAYTPPTIRT